LIEELLGFEYDTTAAGNQVFRHREGEHDDLVLALCLALWDASKGARGEIDPSLATTTGTRVPIRDLETLNEWFRDYLDYWRHQHALGQPVPRDLENEIVRGG
jgi:hypothetical protein